MDGRPRAGAAATNLTKAQQLLWAGQQLHDGVPLYNMAFTFVIDGAIDVPLFRRAFAQLVDACDALRTVVHCVEGVPVQRVLPALDSEVPLVDLSGATDPDARFAGWAQHRCEQPLDIDTCTFDSALVRLGDARFAWFLCQHHVMSDAWSATVLYDWLRAAYATLKSGADAPPELPPYEGYRAFEATLRAEAEGHPHWQAMRGRPAPLLELAGRRPPAIGTSNERVYVELGNERLDRLRALTQAPEAVALTEDLSLFRLVGTALFAFLHRTTGQSTLRIGALSHNRPTRAFKRTAGLFTEVYPLQIEIEPGATFLDVLAHVATESDGYLRAALPGASDAAMNRSINTILNFIRGDFGDFDGAAVHPTWLHPRHVDAEHHLRLQVEDFAGSGRLRLAFDFNCDVFAPVQRSGAIDVFLRILDAMLADWSQPVARVPLMDPPHLEAVRVDEPATVVDLFRARAAAQPDDVAVVDGGRALTYAALDRCTDGLAAALPGAGAVVGVCLPRCAEVVIAMLGAMKSGAAYVPLDPHWPAARIRSFIASSGIEVLLHRAGAAPEVPDGVRTLAVTLDVPAAPIAPGPRPASAALAYVMYTSGSTGAPKGVMIDHRALGNYVAWASRFYDRGRRLAFPLFSPLTFDLTVTSIFTPLISGGSIVVYPETDAQADMAVVRVFEENAVDIVKLTPSHLSLLAEHDLAGSRVKQLILGGEDLTERLARRIHEQFGGDVLIHNEYGPTEGTVGCIVQTYDRPDAVGGSVPIGHAISGMRGHVLDEGLNPVPAGVVGELALEGVGLARGYHGRPDLTAERFVEPAGLGGTRVYLTGDLGRQRSDSTLEYLGRRDEQVKIRGVRIEPAEVEAALLEHPAVDQCVVTTYTRAEPPEVGRVVHCARCGLASSYPGASFDSAGVCNQCRAFDEYEPRAREYFGTMADLEAIFERSRVTHDAEYDCLALLSGGKDSTYVLCRLIDMGLRVLAFTLDNGYISEQANANIRRVVDALGVDHVFGSTPAMDQIFVDSLERHSNVCHGCYKTIYTLSMQLAREKGIPIIVTGLSRGQFFETRLTEELFTDLTVSAKGIDGMVLDARRAYHQVDDAVRRLLDVSMFDDGTVFERVEFVDFYRYCDVDLDELYATLDARVPWVRPSDTGRSTNCLINDVGIYVHKRERGFHNYALPYSWDVRMGHKSRDAALEELDDVIDVESVQRILHAIGYPEEGAEGARLAAYYVGPEELPPDALRRHLRERLPDALVPSRFVRVDSVPMTRHGKVDRAALPAPDASRRHEPGTAFIAPRSDVEQALCDIWAGVLGVDRVGIQDNFFDLGGDSIMAIQIVAQAHRQRLRLTAAQLFESLTVERLAPMCGHGGEAADEERLVGPIAMTPIQRWLLASVENPATWSHVLRVNVPERVDHEAMRAALQAVVESHDAFRMAFARDGGTWTASLLEVTPRAELQRASQADFGRAGCLLDATFDLASPPLLRAAYCPGDGRPGTLELVAHHLIIDAVSWGVLLGDLEVALDGEAHMLRPGESPARWAAELQALATAPALQDEHALWRQTIERAGPGYGTPRDARVRHHVVCERLDAERTRALLQELPAAARVQPNELVVAAVARTLSRWSGRGDVCLFVEGHGREPEAVDSGLDPSRTVGWLTSVFPIVLEVPEGASALLRAVKDRSRGVSRKGLGYGVLRHLDPDAGRRAALAVDEGAHVLFNYLGDGRLARLRRLQVGGPLVLQRDAASSPPFGLEVNAAIVGERLSIDWSFTTQRHDPDEISRVATECIAALGGLIDGCRAGTTDAVAQSDFPMANLDEGKLQKLSALLGKDKKR